MKAPLILIPLELNLSIKPEGKRSPKFWFGDRVEVENKFGLVYGVDYRPLDVFPHNDCRWWYRIRFDTYNCLNSYPENSIKKAEWTE
ncbi:hypothetical protein ACE1CD_15610 [Aerosakkonema sp. BLCC-F183]|uniref:hypothetical protein n=1 Tax=Aerosakkonema sp. BLCC-F183 TaxID=3342834 RepID=UPI0035B9A80F